MRERIKIFLKEHKDLINQNAWEELLQCTLDEKLISSYTEDIISIIEETFKVDLTQDRYSVLDQWIKIQMSRPIWVKTYGKTEEHMYLNTFVSQKYFPNTLGFTRSEIAYYIRDNQEKFDIHVDNQGRITRT